LARHSSKSGPEIPNANTPAGNPIFKLIFIDELNLKNSPQEFMNRFVVQNNN